MTASPRCVWRCFACNAQTSTPEPICDCGVPDSWVRMLPTATSEERRRVPAEHVPPDLRPRLSTREPAFDQLLGGGIARTGKVLLFGGDGAGKSRYGLRLVTSLGPSLVISLEMPLELTVRSAKEAGASLAGMYVVNTVEDWEREAAGCTAILLDSISVVGRGALYLLEQELAPWADRTGGVVVVIAQVNARGRPLGPNKLRHWPDYVIRSSAGAPGFTHLTIQKSRYCPRGEVELPIHVVR